MCTSSKTIVKQPLSKRPKIVFQDTLLRNASQKYCRMLQYFRPLLSYHFSLRPLFCLFLSGRFTVLFNTYFYIRLLLQKNNMWGILGSLEVTSLVPGSWRQSGSMILQTTALTILIWIVLKVVQYVRYRRWLEKEFGDAPGPKEKHWLFGNLANVSYSQPFQLPTWTNKSTDLPPAVLPAKSDSDVISVYKVVRDL